MFAKLKIIFDNVKILFFRVFELVINIMLKASSKILFISIMGFNWAFWVFYNFFSIIKNILIFSLRIIYVFLFFIIESFGFLIFKIVRFNVYYTLFFFNYLRLRFYQIKILVIKLDSKESSSAKSLINVFSRLKTIFFKSKIRSSIMLMLVKTSGFFSVFFYEIFSIIFLLVYWLGFSVVNLIKNFLGFFVKIIWFSLSSISLFFLTIYRNFLRIQFKVFFKFFYSLKLFFFESKVKFVSYVKRKNSFVYGFIMNSKPGYILLVFYLYFLIVFPFLQDLSDFMLSSYFNLSYDNWSWYGSYFPLNKYFADYLPSNEVIELYNNKSAWFFKFGEYGDVFLISMIVTVCYFLIFLPHFRSIWFHEPDWEATEMDVDTDDTEWDEEVDDDEFSEPADSSDAFQDGDELDEYFDELREKSLVKGRVGNNTIAHGYVLTREMGWGVFLSYWIAVSFYTVKTFFWPETGWSPSFQIYDFEETFSNVMPFIEHYPLRNLQIYSSWMPGSPINSPWAAQDMKSWRKKRPERVKSAAAINNFVFDKWNARKNRGYGELGTGRSLTFYGQGKNTTSLQRLLYDPSDLFRSENSFFLRAGQEGFVKDLLYGGDSLNYAIYQNYPIGYTSKMWKRSIWYSRGTLNPMYNYGFNYLDYWPRQNTMKVGQLSLLLDPYFKNTRLDKLSRGSLYGNSEMVGNKRNFMLNKTYKHFIFDASEPGSFPLTYTEGTEGIRRKKKGSLFRKRYFRGHKSYLDSSILTTLGDKQYRSERQIEYYRDRKAPYYLLVYDYGLTPYHLGVSNKWWKWLDKPLTTEPISLKYFLAFLTELNKNFDKSYERYILLKLWQNYWGGKFNVGEYFLNSSVVINRSFGDLSHVFRTMSESKDVRQQKYFKYMFMFQDYYDDIWENFRIEVLPKDVITHMGKFDKEMDGFDLDFATEYQYPLGVETKQGTLLGPEHVAVVSYLFNPLMDQERYKEFFVLWKDLPVRSIEYHLQATLMFEELGQMRYRVPKLAKHVAHNVYKKDTLGVITSLRNKYLSKREFFPAYHVLRALQWKNIEHQEHVLFYIFYPNFDSYLDDFYTESSKFRVKTPPLFEWLNYYPEGMKGLSSYLKINLFNRSLRKQAAIAKEEFKEYFEALLTTIALPVFDEYDGTEVDEGLGLRLFPYNSKEFISVNLEPEKMGEFYKEQYEQYKKGGRVMIDVGDTDAKEDYKVILEQYYKRYTRRMENFGKKGFDKYQNFFLKPYLYDLRMRDLMFSGLYYPSLLETFKVGGLRPRWQFVELFDFNNFSFYTLDDSLHYNLTHLDLEDEFPLYKIPSNMYLSEDYIFVKEKIIPLLAQSKNNWIAETENPDLLEKIHFRSKFYKTAMFLEFTNSLVRKIFRFFGLSLDWVTNFLAEFFLKLGLFSKMDQEAFFYVYDNFKQPFVGFENYVENFRVEKRAYGFLEIPGKGDRLIIKSTIQPSKYDFIPGSHLYPRSQDVQFLDEFFGYYRKYFVWEDSKVLKKNAGYFRFNESKDYVLVYDTSWFRPVRVLGYDVEYNLHKIMSQVEKKGLKTVSVLDLFRNKFEYINFRLEGQLSDYDTMARDLSNSKKLGFFKKNERMFPVEKEKENFCVYFNKEENKRLSRFNVNSFSGFSITDKEPVIVDTLSKDFWKGSVTTKYLVTYDLNFLKVQW